MPGVPAPIISFRGVKKAFGPKVVYEDLSLDIHAGEVEGKEALQILLRDPEPAVARMRKVMAVHGVEG